MSLYDKNEGCKWFHEQYDGYSIGLEVDKILFKGKSEFQEILVFKSKSYGNVLVLDNSIQCTERDEFAYQEMITHLPMNCHPNPKKVLVVGGGDGGVIREVLKYPCIEEVILCEIDEKVVEVCKKYLPSMAKSFDNPKVKLVFDDGSHYIKYQKNEFDVIITDSPDNVGPGLGLFEAEYFRNMKAALKANGIVCCQGDNIFMDLPLIKKMMIFSCRIFPKVDYGFSLTPTYPGGNNGFIMCSSSPDTNFREPVNKYSQKDILQMRFKYYHTEIHRACFFLPQFAQQELYDVTGSEARDDNGFSSN